jgi:flagellin
MYEQEVVQAGPDGDENSRITINFYDFRSYVMGVHSLSVLTVEGSRSAIDILDSAIQKTLDVRAEYGIEERRLESIIDENFSSLTNLSAANSRIEDADMAKEFTDLTRTAVMLQSTQSVAAQANTAPESVLELIEKSLYLT